MIATQKLVMSDLSRQKRLDAALDADLTPNHTVDQAIRHYLERLSIPDNGLRWTAFSRGRLLDKKLPLSDVPDVDDRWTVMPEVAAGA
jgi:hypothetical protein